MIRTVVQEQPDVTLDELCARVAESQGVSASRSMTPAPNRRCGVCRTLQALALPLKKSLHDSQRDTPRVMALRQSFTDEVVPTLEAVAKKLKFIDETGAHLGMTRLFGRVAPGQRVVEATPDYSRPHYTTVAAGRDCRDG